MCPHYIPSQVYLIHFFHSVANTLFDRVAKKLVCKFELGLVSECLIKQVMLFLQAVVRASLQLPQCQFLSLLWCVLQDGGLLNK